MTRKGPKPKRASQPFSKPRVFEPRLEIRAPAPGMAHLFDDVLVCA